MIRRFLLRLRPEVSDWQKVQEKYFKGKLQKLQRAPEMLRVQDQFLVGQAASLCQMVGYVSFPEARGRPQLALSWNKGSGQISGSEREMVSTHKRYLG